MVKNIISIILRLLAVLLSGVVLAVIGFIAGLVIGGTLAPVIELVFGYQIVFNGREGYEATGLLGFILGALIGLVGSSVLLFRKRRKE